jgi:hypothetical protein
MLFINVMTLQQAACHVLISNFPSLIIYSYLIYLQLFNIFLAVVSNAISASKNSGCKCYAYAFRNKYNKK